MKRIKLTRLIIAITLSLIFVKDAYASSEEFNEEAIVAIKIIGAKDFCSGVLISSNEVLTATHCVYKFKHKSYASVSEIKVGLGNNLLDQAFIWKEVASIQEKTKVDFQEIDDFIGNDIVKLILSEKVTIEPIQIAERIDLNTELYAWGFGEDPWGYFGIKKSRPLKGVQIKDQSIVFTSGACRGDSGGPILNQHHHIVGIISMSRVKHCVENGERIAQRVIFP